MVSRADAAGPGKLSSSSLQAISHGPYTIHQLRHGYRRSSIVISHHGDTLRDNSFNGYWQPYISGCHRIPLLKVVTAGRHCRRGCRLWRIQQSACGDRRRPGRRGLPTSCGGAASAPVRRDGDKLGGMLTLTPVSRRHTRRCRRRRIPELLCRGRCRRHRRGSDAHRQPSYPGSYHRNDALPASAALMGMHGSEGWHRRASGSNR